MQIASQCTEDYEIDLLSEVLRVRYGYDFRNYSRASFKRRVLRAVSEGGLDNISALIPQVIHEPQFSHSLVEALTVQVTEMFRDPVVFRYLREEIVPILKTWPFVKIWIAGCSSGEEVYSLAILLQEEGIYDRVRLFATDINRQALRAAKEGIYSVDNLHAYQENYVQAGGKQAFRRYFTESYQFGRMDESLRKNIVFSRHNLAVDSVFSEMHLILCRNVMIYFDRLLQDKVFDLFHQSLATSGMLCIGSKESMQFSKIADRYSVMSDKACVYQRLPHAELTG